MENYNFLKTLGSGAYGNVVLAKRKLSGIDYAIKIMSKIKFFGGQPSSLASTAIKEKNILELMKGSKFVARLCESFQDRSNFFIVMEACAADFYYILRQDQLSENARNFYIAEIIEAVHTLHDKRILHNDIKPDNILVAQDSHICEYPSWRICR